MNRISVVLLVCIGILIPVSCPGNSQVDPILESVILKIQLETYLDVTLLDGNRYRGEFSGVQDDSLQLHRMTAEGALLETRALPLNEIIRIRHQGSGTGKGFRTGFTTGAVLGGSLSLLWGIALDSLDGEGGNAGAIAALTTLGALGGGVGIGGLGAGIGAMTRTWYTDYESPLAPGLPPDEMVSDIRLNFGWGMGTAFENQQDYEKTGLFALAGFQKPLGRKLQIGPEIAYYDLDGTIRKETPDYYSIESTSPIITFGILGTLESQRKGWSPYLVLGTGYYVGGGEYLGASIGGGVRFRTERLKDISLEIRDHINIHDDGHSFHPDYFITVGAKFSFAL